MISFALNFHQETATCMLLLQAMMPSTPDPKTSFSSSMSNSTAAQDFSYLFAISQDSRPAYTIEMMICPGLECLSSKPPPQYQL